MNEKLQYATMLEIPVNTCSVTFTPAKKRKNKKKKKVNHETVKQELLNKVNTEFDEQNAVSYEDNNDTVYDNLPDTYNEANLEEQSFENLKPKKGGKFSIIGVQIAVVGALIATIFLTNAFYPDSGINAFMNQVFGSNNEQVATVDDRVYSDFAPVIAIADGNTVALNDGVINFSGEGSIYAPCNGKISAITLGEDGKYTIEVTHSENFKTLLSGIDYAYVGLDDEVYFNIPVGYVEAGGVQMCFKGEDGVSITDYEIVDNAIIWAV